MHRSRTDEQLGADLGVGEAVTGQMGDLGLLGGEDLAGVQGVLADGLAGGRELAPGALGERLGTDAAERVVGVAKLLPRVHAPVLPTQPFAVHQPGPG
jgi:hypothetical protein